MKFISFILTAMVFSACVIQVPGGQGVDECRFHKNPLGYGYRWNSLPVPLTLHQSMNSAAISSVVKIAKEWNDAWRKETGRDEGLFEILGVIDYYSHPLDVVDDDQNTLAILDSEHNRKLSNGSNSLQASQYVLKKTQQGVTQIRGRLKINEADIFINNDHNDFYYEEQDEMFLASLSETSRGPANFKESIFKRIMRILPGWIFFWHDKDMGRQPKNYARRRQHIPRHLIDFESLMAHEMGHVLGLGHNNIPGSIMGKYLAHGTVRRGLRPVEMESLRCGYDSK